MTQAGLNHSEVQVRRCSNCGEAASHRDEFCSGCGYLLNPTVNTVSFRKALVTVVAALYLPFVPVLVMASQSGVTDEFLRWAVVWPVAWLAIMIEFKTHHWPSAVACLLPLIATLIAAVGFAKQSRVALLLTAVVLASYSSLQALIAILLIWSTGA